MPDWQWQRPPEPPPLPTPPLWDWRHLQKGERSALIGGAITLVVILVCGSLAVIGAANRPTTSPLSAAAVSATETAIVSQVSATSTALASVSPTAPIRATATPRLTATPNGPHIITGPYLGGTAAAFAAAFGQPTDRGGQPYYDFTTSNGLSGSVCFCISEAGTDDVTRLDTLEVTSSGGWGYDQCGAVLRLFFPPDGHAVTTISDPYLGSIQVYQSPDLARTFPAADFTNGGPGGGLVPPGTFSVIAQDPAQQTCGMNIGE